MQNNHGLLAIIVPLKKKKNFPLLANPFLKKGYVIDQQKFFSLQQQIAIDFPAVFFKGKIVLDLTEKDAGTSFIVFDNLPSLQYWVGNRVKVAVVATGHLPQLRSIYLNQQNFSNTGIVPLPLDTHEYLFMYPDRPHLMGITPEGKIHCIYKGGYVGGKQLTRLLRQKYTRKEEA